MADISQYLENIASAIYGEDVRGSIHDAIDIINKVGIKTLTLGTAVTSSSSSIAGYYQDSVYFNTSTKDVWKCDGTQWVLQGNTKGDKGDTGTAATIAVGTVTGGATASIRNSGTSSAAVFDFVLPKGDKGETGDGLTAESSHSGTNTTVSIKNTTTQAVVDTFTVPDGVPGATGNGIASIAKTATAGLVDTYTITFTDGTTTTFTVTNGADGQGAGDMTKSTYDPVNAVADAGGIPAYVSAHAGTTYTGEKGVVVAGTTIKAALANDSASALASETISSTADRQYAVNLDSNNKLSVNVPWVDQVNADWNSSSGKSQILNKPTIPDAVVANPSAEATDSLTKLQIGSTVYSIEGGGGTTIVQIPSVVGDSFTYNGIAQGPTITGLDSTHCTVTGETAVNAGTYTMTIALNDPSSMVWSDLTTADKTYSYTIAKANQTLTLSKNSVTLDANTLTDTVTVSGASTSLSATSSDDTVASASVSGSTVTISNVNQKTGTATISISAAADANHNASAAVSVSVTATFSITKTITVYSAASDTLTFTDESGSKTVTTDSSGVGSASVTILPNGSSITFTSSVAKNPSNLSADYSKTISVTSSTTALYIMPDNVCYWWGYKSSEYQVVSNSNGWVNSGDTFEVPTENTNYVALTARTGGGYDFRCAFVYKDKQTANKAYAITQGITIGAGRYASINALSGKTYANSILGTANNTNQSLSKFELDCSSYGQAYIAVQTVNGGSVNVYALWHD